MNVLKTLARFSSRRLEHHLVPSCLALRWMFSKHWPDSAAGNWSIIWYQVVSLWDECSQNTGQIHQQATGASFGIKLSRSEMNVLKTLARFSSRRLEHHLVPSCLALRWMFSKHWSDLAAGDCSIICYQVVSLRDECSQNTGQIQQQATGASSGTKLSRSEMNVLKTMITVIVCFIVFWSLPQFWCFSKLLGVIIQPDYVSTLPGKTKNNTKAAHRLMQWVMLNRMFQTFVRFFPCFLKNAFTVFWQKNLLNFPKNYF